MGVDTQMLVRTRTIHTAEQVRRLAVDLCEAFGPDRFWIGEDWPLWDDEYENQIGKGRHALSIVKKYAQDGDDIVPDAGEQFIEAHLATRYYGEGYERGDLPFIIAVAEWLEFRIPDARLFYGGDSSGICAEPFDRASRTTAFRHFATVGHRPYTGGFGRFTNAARDVMCGFCDYAMHHCGGGGGLGLPTSYEFYRCGGCGKQAVRRANGTVVIVPKGKDYSDVAREVAAS